MMIAEIVTVGTEIVSGSILNTNATILSEKLLELGIEAYYHTSVDDDKLRLASVIDIALNRADLIITTGGLGPTKDDLTKEVIAELLDLELVLDSNMEEKISQMFLDMNKSMTENNRKQALKPKNSIFIENTIGTAPGIFININNKKIIMLPGPPSEMTLMFDNYVIPLIKEDFYVLTKSINTIGIGESTLETKLLDMNLSTRETNITTFAKMGTVEIKIIGKGKNRNKLKNEIDNITLKLSKELKQYIYGYDNISIEEVVLDMLKERKYILGLCESCTGGLIASKITRIPGASNVLDRSIITYSNQSKIDELNVNASTLKKYSPVSKEISYEMAKGLLDKSNIDLAFSITGYAGPNTKETEEDVGLIYMCIMTKYKYKVIKCKFSGDRQSIQDKAAIKALNEIRMFLLKNH